MTQVSKQSSRTAGGAALLALVLWCAPPATPQALPEPQALTESQAPAAEPRPRKVLGQGEAAALYRRLAAAELDPGQVYVVREGYLDREDVRILLSDGTIGFLRAIDGRVTGAYFEGEGELLVIPPDRAERNSLGLFTGQAVLQEKFTSAYFRFNDDAFARLQPDLRRRVEGAGFVERNQPAVAALAEGDALRLLRTYVNTPAGQAPPPADRMLHARLAGTRLGVFDVFFDTTLQEQVWVGQVAWAEGLAFFDRWLNFTMRSARQERERARRAGNGSAPGPLTQRREADFVRVSEYALRVEVRPPEELEVEAELSLEALEPGHRIVLFELSRFLQVQSVEAGGRALEFVQNEALEGTDLARRGNDLVAVIFPQPLVPGSRQRLRFRYAGAVMSAAGGGLLYVGARGIWYPSIAVDFADFDLTFRHPAEWTLVATGELESERAEEEWKVARWVTSRPIPFAGFNLGQYERATAEAGSVRVETYAARAMEDAFRPPATAVVVPRPTRRNPMGRAVAITPPPVPRPARNAQMVAEQAARTVEFLAARLGPYPFTSLTLSQMPGRDSQGWPTLVLLSSYAFLTPEEKAALRLGRFETALFGSVVPAHEIAHQWWGDAVLWAGYRDQWLIEALANYSALLQLEQESAADFDVVMEQYRRALLARGPAGREVGEAGPVTLGVRLSSSKFPRGYDAVAYGRGTWLLHMLRHMLLDASRTAAGEAPLRGSPQEPFVRALRALRERYEGRALSTDGLREVMEEAVEEALKGAVQDEAVQDEAAAALRFEGRTSLDWFFEEWVEGSAVPALELAGVRIAQENGQSVARGRIRQKNAPETIVTSVPLWAETAEGRRFVARIFAEGEETAFRVPVPATTRRLLLDPEKTVLTRP